MFRINPTIHLLRRAAAILALALSAGACGELPTSAIQDEYGNEYENFTATPPGACTPDGALAMGTPRQGAIEEGDCSQFPGDRYDRWTLSLDADTDVRIDMRSGAFDTMLELLGANGQVIAVNDDAYGTLNSRIVTFLPRGSYDVIARTFAPGMRGSYEIGVEVTEGCDGTAIVLGEEITGEVTAADCLLDQWMPADSFSLTLPEDARLDFVAKSTDFRPLLVVRDERRWDVFVAYDESGTGTAQGRATLTAGTYVVYVLPDGEGRGTYQLLVEEVECDAPRSIDVGETVEGTLDESDCVRSGGAFRDAWSLVLEAERTLRIDLASTDLDAWLSVTDEDGVEIAHDDDSGPGFDSFLRITLGPGRYTVLASSFGPGDAGDYSLSVIEEGSAAAGATLAGTASVVAEPTVMVAGVMAAGPRVPKEARPSTQEAEARRLLQRLQTSRKGGV